MKATKVPILKAGDFAAWLARPAEKYQADYLAMYSSLVGGVVTDPRLMLVPLDDHMVHRGDAIFETFKSVGGFIYNLAAHFARLRRSAEMIRLACPWSDADLRAIVCAAIRAGGRRDGLVRILLSRGPGGLGVNPYECPVPALYVVVYVGKPPFMQAHPAGAKACATGVAVKPGFFAAVKSVNYLPNALMKMEAADRGADFALGFDENGCLAESATENAAVVTAAGELCAPPPGRILEGTTLLRALALAPALVSAGLLRGVARRPVPRAEVDGAREILILGTTPDVTSVVDWEGRPVGDGRPGPVGRALGALLDRDIAENAALRTAVW